MTAHGDIAFERFQAWADGANQGQRVSLHEMARRTGRSAATFSASRARGAVGAQHVIAYARHAGVSPVSALRACLDWPFLVDDPAPSTREWLSQMPHGVLLAECARRLDEECAQWKMPAEGTTVARWLEASVLRSKAGAANAAEAAGLTMSSYVNKKSRGTFTLEELRALAGMGGHSLRMALVAQGGLTWQEVGLDGDHRADVLARVEALELLDYLEASMGQMRRVVRATEQDKKSD